MVATRAQSRAIGQKGGEYVAKKLKFGAPATQLAGEIGRRLGGAAHSKAFSYVKKLAGFKRGGMVMRSSRGRFKRRSCH